MDVAVCHCPIISFAHAAPNCSSGRKAFACDVLEATLCFQAGQFLCVGTKLSKSGRISILPADFCGIVAKSWSEMLEVSNQWKPKSCLSPMSTG